MIVNIIMGSQSDYHVMREAEQTLDKLFVKYDTAIVSAHRSPDRMYDFCKNLNSSVGVIIAAAGGAAHLPGMVAAMVTIPVIGVPIKSSSFNGFDSLLSIVQMPYGVPVATVAVNGAKNSAILAASMLGIKDNAIHERVQAFRQNITDSVPHKPCI